MFGKFLHIVSHPTDIVRSGIQPQSLFSSNAKDCAHELGPGTHSRTALPDDIPWHQTVGLLLDAVQVEDLLKRLYQWVDSPCVNVLYLGTRFGALKDVSPCLVQIKGEYDPILAQFLENLDRHWGYLLISEGPWVQLVAHLRWLISIEHPSGQEMLLRIASTDVVDFPV
ncbi:DUF4123 domain-containing protein [Pseudomonas sp. 10B1]|uniref:DUF4123 domain-containing protein n=1 Tax=unclassified Pseudomonas TaxID=196821 RepID=UPI002B2225FC|nr:MULTISPECIES: DUF4123 domain-containing protein [unclassified Pseudomonas]MEA9997364.1 DUF4123 domain-containing protein [Pseudomonas sp. AA4]MEB0087706.1 DUF4123 domain-containing protein [Pseudomonas sp. RTI1]MEB0127713.1 DUF4123 domain-containing protein [Pseudomonas sp. CCC1.2]MEB0155775.1 DUF4123 domain-containing protein [Pseudomonas sp. CCC4.3]MEB0222022.1 DUF4123 domain-containing protein [Pseudomonas sp. AB12(2023)]